MAGGRVARRGKASAPSDSQGSWLDVRAYRVTRPPWKERLSFWAQSLAVNLEAGGAWSFAKPGDSHEVVLTPRDAERLRADGWELDSGRALVELSPSDAQRLG